jgi:hypothetical protein
MCPTTTRIWPTDSALGSDPDKKEHGFERPGGMELFELLPAQEKSHQSRRNDGSAMGIKRAEP